MRDCICVACLSYSLIISGDYFTVDVGLDEVVDEAAEEVDEEVDEEADERRTRRTRIKRWRSE